jgi:hypothetical protein
MNILESYVKHNQSVSEFTNPFKSDCVTWIFMNVHRNSMGIYEFKASVEFTNNSTEGKQNFRADSFELLVEKVQSFIKTLN